MREMCGRGGCLLYAEINGVLKPESSTNSGAHVISHHRLNQVISMTCCSFDASTKIHLTVHPSYLQLIRFARLVRASPWTSPAASHTSVTGCARAGWRRDRTLSRVHSRPLPSCDLVSHWTSPV